MKIVLDTNVLLVSISSRSKYHWILKELIAGSYSLCISGEILLEYEEIIARHMGSIAANNTIEGLLLLPRTILVDRYFSWNLITQDPDDNKFADCAISCGADYLVSEDRHFQILKTYSFPKINLLSVSEFRDVLQDLSE